MNYLVFLFLCLFATTASAAGKISTEKKRVLGAWEVHCTVAYPQEETHLEKTIGRLRTQCEIAALRLSVKQHARSGEQFAAELSKEKIDAKKEQISVIARLVGK